MATPHPRLREWHEDDLPALYRLQTNPDVAWWLGGAWSMAECAAALSRMIALRERTDCGMWAVLDDAGEIVGAAGTHPVNSRMPFAPAIEAAWRLLPGARRKGLATSVMRPILAQPRGPVIAYTAASNLASVALMFRLGFTHVPANDFDHPGLPEGHELRPHRFYRLTS